MCSATHSRHTRYLNWIILVFIPSKSDHVGGQEDNATHAKRDVLKNGTRLLVVTRSGLLSN